MSEHTTESIYSATLWHDEQDEKLICEPDGWEDYEYPSHILGINITMKLLTNTN